MPTNEYELLKQTFQKIGVKFEECDERQLKTDNPIPGATKYLSVLIAHYHFAEDGRFLGTECNGDGTVIPRFLPAEPHSINA